MYRVGDALTAWHSLPTIYFVKHFCGRKPISTGISQFTADWVVRKKEHVVPRDTHSVKVALTEIR